MKATIALVVLMSVAVLAHGSNGNGLYFGGSFQVGDPYCHYCADANTLSDGGVGCQCPVGYEAYPPAPLPAAPFQLKAQSSLPLMRVSSTCAAGGKQWHASLSMCIASPHGYVHNTSNLASPMAEAAQQFAGFYQTVNGECRVVNPLSKDCSCPSDSESIVIRHASPVVATPVAYSAFGSLRGDGATVTGELVFCGRRSNVNGATNFGGAYTTANGVCHTSNPFSGQCSCPAGSSATLSTMVGVNGESMILHVCGPIVTRATSVQICDGVSADNSGITDAAPAINQCFLYKREVRLPLGTYQINTPLMTDGGRIEAQSFFGQTCLVSASPCPVLKAGSGLVAPMFTGRADFYNVVFDGNRIARSAALCLTNSSNGINIIERAAPSAGGFQAQGIAVVNALCGAGLFSQIGGGFFSGAQIQSSLFSGNGDHNDGARTWASGIHVGIGSNGFQAQQNYYVDNSDCHVAVDELSTSVELEQSTYVSQAQQSFAAIRDSYPVGLGVSGYSALTADEVAAAIAVGRTSNFGNQYQQNTINGNGRMYFGIQIGGRPWNSTSPVTQSQGIEVEENTVSGAVVLINWDAGVGQLQQNTYGAILGKFNRCANLGAALNISPDSRVSRQSESVPAISTSYVGCVP